MIQIEIDLTKLERGTHIGRVKVTRGGKTFYRKQRVGRKEKEKEEIPTPNPEIMEYMKHSHDIAINMMSQYGIVHNSGFVKVDAEKGTFTWQNLDYTDWSTGVSGGISRKAKPVDFRVEGNTIIRMDDNSQITVPIKEIDNLKEYYGQESPKWFSYLDSDWGGTSKRNYEEYRSSPDKYEDRLKEFDDFIPEYEDAIGEGVSKYSKRMELKSCSNRPEFIFDNLISAGWYGGNSDLTALIGESVQEVVSGRYNEDNVIQMRIPLMVESACKVNKKYGEDTIYRGETNVSAAKELLLQIDEFGDSDLADKLFSCTENEKLGRWYASVHNQPSARGIESKTYVMLKIPREKFEDNVIMDYRVNGSFSHPEQEVTIVGNDIKLTGDNVMVNANTPKRKTKKWMTFTQFKSEGGETQNLIDQMVGEK